MIRAKLEIVLLTIFVGLLLIVPLDIAYRVEAIGGIEPVAQLSLIKCATEPMSFTILGGALLSDVARRLTGACCG